MFAARGDRCGQDNFRILRALVVGWNDVEHVNSSSYGSMRVNRWRRQKGPALRRRYEHFVFGVMRRNAAIKLIHVHIRHHLAIVNDILAKETP